MDSFSAFREKLDQEHKWPAVYVFKFVVPKASKGALIGEFPGESFTQKASRSGNYISFTLKKTIQSSEEVVSIYLRASKIDGVIAL